MRALLIDDEPFALKIVSRQLARLGVSEVSLCEQADEALQRVDAAPSDYDVIFCDLNMPGMDGVELVRHLAEHHFGGCVVLVSGEEDRILRTAADLARRRKLRLLGALRKPVALADLQWMLGEATRHVETRLSVGSKDPVDVRELREALETGRIINYYQPQVDIASGRVIGVETLVRLRRPMEGVVAPNRFIAVAEANGLIEDLTLVVLEAALLQARTWQDGGLPLRVAVNVSMDCMRALDLPDTVARRMAELRLPPERLVLEVTESQLITDPITLLDIGVRLRLKRIGLAIDDFGTGYSSLAQLRDVPFDELKIDRGFVHGASRDSDLRALLESNLVLARRLGIRVVAEGVECPDDYELLRQLGCDVAQGYLIARPMPADEVTRWLGRRDTAAAAGLNA
jgi:EAL domain-containing protein (putative c-di-GMP-specific phosphodiesterase class I)/FixJ family two-component response regulator